MCAASTRITTAGASAAMPAGVMTTCCPISRRPRTSSAAPTTITAPAARCRCRTGATPIRCRKPSSKAAVEAGMPDNPDFNGATQEGAGFFQTTTRRGRRASHRVLPICGPRMKPRQSAWSRPRRWRSASCSKAAAPRAVEYKQDGQLRTARARKEILVSSGAYNSPQLLQLSGVGPADLLKQPRHRRRARCARRRQRSAGPHAGADGDALRAEAVTLNDIVNHPVRRMHGRSALCRVSQGAADDRRRHIGRVLQDQSAAGVARYPDPLPAVFDRQDGREAACAFRLHGVGVPAAAREPRLAADQRARIRRRRRKSASTILRPRPTAGANVEGLRILREILAAPALKPFVVDEVDPGAKVASDDELLDYLPAHRQHGLSSDLDLPDGQRSPRGGRSAAACARLEGLRVVDASIMPDLMSGNTNAPPS